MDFLNISDPLLSSNQITGFDFTSPTMLIGSGGPPSPPWDDDDDVLMDFKLEDVSSGTVTPSDVDEFLSYSPSSLRLDSETDSAINSFLKSSHDINNGGSCYSDEEESRKSFWKELSDDLCQDAVMCTACNKTFASLDKVANHECTSSDQPATNSNQQLWRDLYEIDTNNCSLNVEPLLECTSITSDLPSSVTVSILAKDIDKCREWKDVCVSVIDLDDVQAAKSLFCDACKAHYTSVEHHICSLGSDKVSLSDEDVSSLSSFSSADEDMENVSLWKDVCVTMDTDNNNVVPELPLTTFSSEVGHCSVCKLVFTTPQKLESHRQAFASKVACCHCSKKFANVSKLRIHHRKHSKEKPFHCDWCGKYYTHRNTLVRHQQLYCQPLKAKENGPDLVNNSVVESERTQIRIQSVELSSKCKTKSQLKVEKVKADLAKVTSCAICDSEFFDAKSLENHRQYHLTQRSCCQCHKVMGSKSKLMIHHRSHTKELPYACTVCDRSFAEKSTLRKHAATHGEKTFQCSQCDKAFVRKDYLAKHALTHRQTYKCSHCSFICYERLDIEQHVAQHPKM